MDPESEDIQSHNILVVYRRPRFLEKYCLADFASELWIEYSKGVTFDDPFDDNVDDEPIDPYAINITDEFIMQFPNSIVIKNEIINGYYDMLTII